MHAAARLTLFGTTRTLIPDACHCQHNLLTLLVATLIVRALLRDELISRARSWIPRSGFPPTT